jgi:hypothetical protein
MKFELASQNSKLKESSKNSDLYELYNIGIPAYKSQSGIITCPNAKHCISGCYARNGAYLFSNVAKKYEERLNIVQSIFFMDTISRDIDKILARIEKKTPNKRLLLRINDSGDLFDEHYRRSFIQLANKYTDIHVYAYTKMVRWAKSMSYFDILPQNATLILSYGGTEDHLIDPKRDRHAKVFEYETDIPSHYANASHDDTVAIGNNPNIGLAFHHRKNYANTGWKNV